MRIRLLALALSLMGLQACASMGSLNNLGALIQPPRFEQVPDQPAEIRLQGTSGAGVRLWTRVTNPNPFGLRLGTLKGTLYLEDSRAADADFPLGLPLAAGGDSVIPIDISISFSDLPRLGVSRSGSWRGRRCPTTSKARSASMQDLSGSRCSAR
jgi:hypothetical protein